MADDAIKVLTEKIVVLTSAISNMYTQIGKTNEELADIRKLLEYWPHPSKDE